MKREMIIYKTTCLVNGKIYVGMDTRNDPKYLGSGVMLGRAIEKYGKENFEKTILEFCETFEELARQEMHWIKLLDARNREVGYNLAAGGFGGWSHIYSTMTQEEKLAKGRRMIENWSHEELVKKLNANVELGRQKKEAKFVAEWKNLRIAQKDSEGKVVRIWQDLLQIREELPNFFSGILRVLKKERKKAHVNKKRFSWELLTSIDDDLC